MAKFVPSSPERLEYDFTPVLKSDDTHCQGKGTIPEPNRAQLKEYREQIAEGYKKLGIGSDEISQLREGEVPENFSDISQQMRAFEVSDDINLATRNLLGNFPTVLEHYEELPVRFQDDFGQWLMGELLNPEGASGGGEQSPETGQTDNSNTPSGVT